MKLEIVYPTYNGATAVNNIIESFITSKHHKNCLLSIHDSSPNDETKDVVALFLEKGLVDEANLRYFRYDANINVDDKTLIAIKKAEAEYAYLIGDGWLTNLDYIFDSNILMKNDDVICVYNDNIDLYRKHYQKNMQQLASINNRDEFYKFNYWYLILYSSSIISQKVVSRINQHDMILKFAGYGFIYPTSIVYATDKNFKFSIYLGPIAYQNDAKKVSGWVKNKEALKIWCKHLVLTLETIPNEIMSEDVKEHIIQTTGKRTRILTLSSLFRFKLSDNFTWKLYKKYKYYFKMTKGCSILGTYLILLFPSCILKSIRNIKKFLRKKV